ncbi:hypothetical protein CALVIDRAFT_542498 [Calocera viscosa TUFC12733]|uniref:UBX domain-containing protein n=1 Tax=Calocera viscosa (strain TUFC12733) TaxID=1330018 RepID=A0A167GJV8_CALVF|nr:hypothetical protein CALVIDRAFT_542498 [Calocera viscosa TUFC12733]
MAPTLTPEQTDLLAQLQSITNSSNIDTDVRILQAADWDLQRAVQMIYDEGGAASHLQASSSRTPAGTSPSATIEQMEVDDSAVGAFGQPARYRPVSTAYPNTWMVGLNLVNIFALPITMSIGLLSNLLQFILRLLGIPVPRFLRTSSATYTSLRGPPPIDDPMVAADRLVRQLEEETGAVCVSRVGLSLQDGETVSTLSTTDGSEKRKILPDFWIGSYKTALDTAKKDIRILCVILMSEEHQDMSEFRRNVLTDPDLVRVLTDNAILAWAGDVRDREAYEVAQSLQATTYPFVAFIALQAKGPRTPGASSSASATTRLAVLSRHEGSPSSATSAPTLQAYITSTLLPRITPLLTRLRNEQRARQAERLLREEQDRAFRDAEKRDRERIEKKRGEERARLQAEGEKRRQAEEEALRAERTDQWRRWARKSLVPPEMKDGVRIGVRLADGRRLIRNFARVSTLEHLYAFVDVQSLSDDSATSVDSDFPPPNYTPEWDFQLASTYPRIEIPFAKDMRIMDIPALQNGANLIAEVTRNGQHKAADDSDSDDD